MIMEKKKKKKQAILQGKLTIWLNFYLLNNKREISFAKKKKKSLFETSLALKSVKYVFIAMDGRWEAEV